MYIAAAMEWWGSHPERCGAGAGLPPHAHRSPSRSTLQLMALVVLVALVAQGPAGGGATNVNWCPRQCACFNVYRTADCSRQSLTVIPILSNLTTYLYLENNALAYLPPRAFSSLPNLLVLQLRDNSLAGLTAPSFCGLAKLKTLNLSANRIAVFQLGLPSAATADGVDGAGVGGAGGAASAQRHVGVTDPILDDFGGGATDGGGGAANVTSGVTTEVTTSAALPRDCVLYDLKELILSGNRLREIPRDLSLFAPTLEILNMSVNDIQTAFLDSSYGALTSLRVLDLSRNRIHEVDGSDLAALSLVPLETLSLSYNQLVSVDPSALAGMVNLTSLLLAANLVDVAQLSNVFQQIGNGSQLTRLDLRECFLHNLTAAMLGAFHFLVNLDVTNSAVQRLEPELLAALPDLETLHLQDNQLVRLENLSAASRLRRLNLARNRLRDLDLSGLISLESVDVSGNRLGRLPGDWLPGPRANLRLLNASHNGLTAVDPQALRGLELHTLDLSHNALTALDDYGLRSVHNLVVTHNSLVTVHSQALDSLYQDLQELDLSHNNLTALDIDTFNDFQSLQKLDLSSNALGEAFARGDTAPGMLGDLFSRLGLLQKLDLSGNNVTRLCHQQMAHLHHLTTLELGDNGVRSLGELSLLDLRTLVKLTVSGNRLRAVDTDLLGQMEYLEEIDLGGNPFYCSCMLLPFLQWLNTTFVSVLDRQRPDRYRCATPPALEGATVFSFHPEAAPQCHSPDTTRGSHPTLDVTTIVGITVACVLVTIMLIGILLFYGQICHQIKNLHYRWQIRYREVSGVEFAAAPDPKA